LRPAQTRGSLLRMRLTPEELRALAEKAPLLTCGLNPTLGGSTNDGPFLIETDLAGTAALVLLRETADLVVSTPVGDTLDAFARTIRMSRDTAAELIERIDRGDDPQEIMSFAYRALRGNSTDDIDARHPDERA